VGTANHAVRSELLIPSTTPTSTVRSTDRAPGGDPGPVPWASASRRTPAWSSSPVAPSSTEPRSTESTVIRASPGSPSSTYQVLQELPAQGSARAHSPSGKVFGDYKTLKLQWQIDADTVNFQGEDGEDVRMAYFDLKLVQIEGDS